MESKIGDLHAKLIAMSEKTSKNQRLTLNPYDAARVQVLLQTLLNLSLISKFSYYVATNRLDHTILRDSI